MRLSPAQLRAAALALSPEWCLHPDPFDGPSLRTLRSLQKRGWLVPDDPDDLEGEWSWTDDGWEAVAPTPAASPSDPWSVVRAALARLVGDTTGFYRPAETPRQWFSSEEVALDFTDAVAVLDVAALVEAGRLSGHLASATDETLLQLCEAAAALASRWGRPVAASTWEGAGGACVSYWLE